MNIRACNLSQFIRLAKGKQIFCIGAGKGAITFYTVLAAHLGRQCVTALVDNDRKKWGTTKKIEEGEISIISVQDMMWQMEESAIIVVTCMDMAGIYNQLNAIEELKDICIYFYVDILGRRDNEDDGLVLRQVDEMRIPKVIHYCWFGRNPIPDVQKEWMKSWKKYCPDYDIVEWNEDNYDVFQNPYMKQAYDAGMWGFVPDYARLDIVYKHGGIYLDTDVELTRSLDDLLYQDGYCAAIWKLVGLGLGFGARKGMPIIAQMRDYYDNISFLNRCGEPDTVACTIHQYQILKKYGYIPNGKYQIIEGLTILPDNILCNRNIILNTFEITDNTFSLHHSAWSWNTKESNGHLHRSQKLIQEMFK